MSKTNEGTVCNVIIIGISMQMLLIFMLAYNQNILLYRHNFELS